MNNLVQHLHWSIICESTRKTNRERPAKYEHNAQFLKSHYRLPELLLKTLCPISPQHRLARV